jgi:uncharacterized membrane protein YphA (DoxX/SURF4 family)
VAGAAPIAIPAPRTRRIAGVLLLIGRIALGAIFIYAAYAKLHFNGAWRLRDYHFVFAFGIDSYQMLPLWAVQLVARVLPWLEVALGVFLIAGIGLRWVASITTALLVVFMIALARAAILGLAINCGCFGQSSVSPATELLLDSVLLLVSLAVTVGAFLSHRARRLPA